MRTWIIVAAVLCWLTTAHTAQAFCWRASEMKGVGYRAGESYKQSPDGFSSGAITVFEIRGGAQRASVTGYDDMICRVSAPNQVVCQFSDADRNALHIWTVDEAAGAVIYVKSLAGYGTFDGAAVMRGRLAGRC